MNKIYQKTFLGGKNAGFTLIELLVVVLIIGILAAVAVPQYQFAVEKARAAEAFIILKNIAMANRTYYLANGKYAVHLDDLDIEIPGKDTTYNGWRRKESKYFQYGTHGVNINNTISVANRLPIITSYVFVVYDTGTVGCLYYSQEGKRICQIFNLETQSIW